jgi:hypothetical protein
MSVKAGVPYIHVGHRGTHSHTARRLNSALLDFNRKSAGHVESVSSLFVGEVAKFYYQPAPKITKRKFHLVLPERVIVESCPTIQAFQP